MQFNQNERAGGADVRQRIEYGTEEAVADS